MARDLPGGGPSPIGDEEPRDPLEFFGIPLATGDAYHGHDGLRPIEGQEDQYAEWRNTPLYTKRWGTEEWVWNDAYCGKILTVNDGTHTSYHYHINKDETFYILSGTMVLYLGTNRAITNVIELGIGDRFNIPPRTIHCIAAKPGSNLVFAEFSTHHEDADSYRVLFPSNGGL